MKPQDPDFSQHSRLAQHLAVLDPVNAPLSPESIAAEAAFIEGMEPHRLRLPQRASARKLWILAPIALAAAAITLMIRQPPATDETWQVKGSGHVQVFVEQNGTVQKLEDAGPVPANARVKTEVLATTPTIAFLMVRNREGRPLQEAADIWRQRLTLTAGETKAFPGSLQLDGVSEGETLCVLQCPQTVVDSGQEARLILDMMEAFAGKPTTDKAFTACKNACFSLRP